MTITPDPHRPQIDTPTEIPMPAPGPDEVPQLPEFPTQTPPDSLPDDLPDPGIDAPPETRDDPDYIRPAGRREMDLPPETWDILDETIDESFPASDPPGNY
ncbi:hypothetical protein [Falsigemmobacter faecalis]|uniref:Uncharacterized protein n=1 Tax=Falsigemmobacter faecalis TaxID=2488730 RepID=A0A3P3DKP9_9RHOB|nr:hypothetical protein [Falsigemmobacter faecalis]RRH73208.1 hypothetical protein EG244_13390 [Falsigemmobacter faecalis]